SEVSDGEHGTPRCTAYHGVRVKATAATGPGPGRPPGGPYPPRRYGGPAGWRRDGVRYRPYRKGRPWAKVGPFGAAGAADAGCWCGPRSGRRIATGCLEPDD